MKKKLKNIAGVTLIEILIGIVISVVMMAAMFSSYNAVNSVFQQVTDKAKISQSGRDILGMLLRKFISGLATKFEPLAKKISIVLFILVLLGAIAAERENVISYLQTLPTEFGLDKQVDYDLQFSKSFLEPIKVIMDKICLLYTSPSPRD